MFQQQTAEIQTKICEVCGAVFMKDYGYSVVALWAVTGYHEGVPMFYCPNSDGGNHWGCTPGHAIQALMECLKHDEHMSEAALLARHAAAEAEGHPKIALEHLETFKANGNTHILKKV